MPFQSIQVAEWSFINHLIVKTLTLSKYLQIVWSWKDLPSYE